MAAADYYTPETRLPTGQRPSGLYPPPGPQRASSQPVFSFQPPPQSGPPNAQFPGSTPSPYPPPPYQPINHESKPSVHFAQSPSPSNQQYQQHRPSVSNQPRPDPYTFNQPNYQASPAQQLAPYHQPYMPQNYQVQQRPYTPPRHSSADLSGHGGYASEPEVQRRKHKERSRRISDHSRSTKADAFLGAAGGGLIGDLIFPGLGTVGGALVGWVGGKDYGKHRKWREDKRDREQERWERKYGSDRSRSHSGDDGRRSSHDGRGSHERKASHDGRDGHDRRGSHDRRKSYD